jgi:signal transduction histidine kinase
MDTRLPSTVRGIALGALLALAVTALELSNVFIFKADEHHDALGIVLLLVTTAPLVLWRRRPFVVLQLTGNATIALAGLHAVHLGLGPIAATYAVACWSGTSARRVTVVLLLAGVWLVPLLTADVSSVPTNAALFGAAWILGALMRDRRISHAALEARTVELAREREERAALAAASERARIGRELHDVLTHSVSVMVIQAQAAQAAGLDHERITTALSRIEAVGQEALTELRSLLRHVRPEDEPLSRTPQPGLERIDELVEEVRAAGVDVTIAREGTVRAVPASVGLSAYRIVQEALTNTMRHAGGAPASVVLRYLPDELSLEVLDEGAATSRLRVGQRRGLAGMRERATLVGGTLVAEGRPEGGFRVAARLPLRSTP